MTSCAPYLLAPHCANLPPVNRADEDRPFANLVGDLVVEHHGTFGTIWASLGMTAYYMAITWINILLGLFLGPLFMIPLTWAQDAIAGKK
jgi:hypothetical protein